MKLEIKFPIILMALVVLLASCQIWPLQQPAESTDEEPVADMANPASVFCEEQGGTVEIRTDASGGQYSVCVFEDGSECEEWAFFHDECQPGEPEIGMANPASVFCEEQGGTVEMRTDASGGQYGVCLFDDGSECDEWAYFRGECEPGSAEAVPSPELAPSYTNEVYGFSLDSSSEYAVEGYDNHILFKRDDYFLFIGYKWAEEELDEPFRTGMPAGEFVDAGTVNVLGYDLPRQHLVFEDKVKNVSYQPFHVGALQFYIWLDAESADYAAVDIPDEILAEADAIVASLALTDGEMPQVGPIAMSVEPTGEEAAIAAAFSAHLGMELDALVVTISEVAGQHAKGGVPGGYFLATKEGDRWVIVHDGQTYPPCEAIEAYEFPIEMVPECLDENDNVVTRSEETSKLPEDFDLAKLGTPTWQDHMDVIGYWYMLDTANVTFEMTNGSLLMKARQEGIDEWGMAAVPDLHDFALEVTAVTGSQCSGIDRYGVIFRSPDPSQGYVFEFSCNGSYRLYKWDGKEYMGLQAWEKSSSILAGANQKNRLGIWTAGSTIRLYANGQFLGEYQDDSYASGKFGVVIGSKSTDNFQVSVDSAFCWEL